MQQRVALCRALLLDPPTAADGRAVRRARRDDARGDEPRAAAHLGRSGAKTIVFVTHSIPGSGVPRRPRGGDDPRPGRVAAVHRVDIARPRTVHARALPEFGRLTLQIYDSSPAPPRRAARRPGPSTEPHRRHASAPRLSVAAVDAFEQPFGLRLPFRFGVITVTDGVAGDRARARAPRRRARGRRLRRRDARRQVVRQEPGVVGRAERRAAAQVDRARERAPTARAPATTAFDLFAEHYALPARAGAALGLVPLVASYGPALLDRAVLDALCRLERPLVLDAMRRNLAGMRPHPVVPDLGGFDFDASSRRSSRRAASRRATPSAWSIRSSPPTRRRARASTTACRRRSRRWSRRYGDRYFKLKVGGNMRGRPRAARRASPA